MVKQLEEDVVELRGDADAWLAQFIPSKACKLDFIAVERSETIEHTLTTISINSQ